MGILDAALEQPTCSNCVYWHEAKFEASGDCRKHSPAPHSNPNTLGAVWPLTGSGEWCGDHERR